MSEREELEPKLQVIKKRYANPRGLWQRIVIWLARLDVLADIPVLLHLIQTQDEEYERMRQRAEAAERDVVSLAKGEYSICDMCALLGSKKSESKCPYGAYQEPELQSKRETYQDEPCDHFVYNREYADREPLFDERRCRVCGCTDDNACPGGCYWVEDDLCSTCADKMLKKLEKSIRDFDKSMHKVRKSINNLREKVKA